MAIELSESVPPPAPSAPPALAARVFGDRLPLAVRYAGWLSGAGVERGLVGPREAQRVWDRHLLNCVGLGALIDRRARIIDIGSGSGLPGLVLALARPDLQVVLVESMLRRTVFLEEVVADLGLQSVEVRRARAEEVDLRADVVTARAVAPLDRLARWAAPLLNEGGEVLALKGAGAQDEVAAAWRSLRKERLTGLVELLGLFPDDAGKPLNASATLLPGVVARRLGCWEASTKPHFRAESELPAGDPLAFVVRLRRFPQALSPMAPIGLG